MSVNHVGPQQLFTAVAGLRARTKALMNRPSTCAMVGVVRHSGLVEKLLRIGCAVDASRFDVHRS